MDVNAASGIVSDRPSRSTRETPTRELIASQAARFFAAASINSLAIVTDIVPDGRISIASLE
jgi:hypothetical protein